LESKKEVCEADDRSEEFEKGEPSEICKESTSVIVAAAVRAQLEVLQ
jgi:hypothetical protein